MSKIFCIVGPSGSGKSSVCKQLIKENNNLFLSVSTTTRAPRKREVEGENYFFVDKEEFKTRIEKGNFLEYAEYNGNFYGTEKKNIELAKNNNKILILDIEYQGVLKLKEEHQVATIFISAPSIEELMKRLVGRKDTSEKDIQSRLEIGRNEVSQLLDNKIADYLVINNNLLDTVSEVENIISAGQNFEEKKIEHYTSEFLDQIRF